MLMSRHFRLPHEQRQAGLGRADHQARSDEEAPASRARSASRLRTVPAAMAASALCDRMMGIGSDDLDGLMPVPAPAADTSAVRNRRLLQIDEDDVHADLAGLRDLPMDEAEAGAGPGLRVRSDRMWADGQEQGPHRPGAMAGREHGWFLPAHARQAIGGPGARNETAWLFQSGNESSGIVRQLDHRPHGLAGGMLHCAGRRDRGAYRAALIGLQVMKGPDESRCAPTCRRPWWRLRDPVAEVCRKHMVSHQNYSPPGLPSA
jgi:hypothetical protein